MHSTSAEREQASAVSLSPEQILALQEENVRLKARNTELTDENALLQRERDALRERVEELLRDIAVMKVASADQVHQLRQMIALSGKIASKLDPQQVLDEIMHDAMAITNAEGSSLWLLQEKENELECRFAHGPKAADVIGKRVPSGQGNAGEVATTGVTKVTRDAMTDERHYKGIDQETNFVTREMITVALRSGERIIGVVQTVNKKQAEDVGGERKTFTEEDVRNLEDYASYASITMAKAEAYQEVKDLFEQSIRTVTKTLDARDAYTHGHSMRVTKYSVAIAKELGLSDEELEDVRLSALLHDIGKIGVRDGVLLKPGKLDDAEFAEIKKHPVIGYELVKTWKHLQRCLAGIRWHHEKMNGKGYPDGLAGDAIPLQARILAVADCFDALTSERCYRKDDGEKEKKKFSPEQAIAIMRKDAGQHHDPVVLEAFVRLWERGDMTLELAQAA